MRASPSSRIATAIAAVALLGSCRRGDAPPVPAESNSAAAASVAPPAASIEAPTPQARAALAPSRADCQTVPAFDEGAEIGSLCVEDAPAHRMTVVDLSDEWTPAVFARDPVTGDASPYRARYVGLANQRAFDLGVFGIAPSLGVVTERLLDDKRQACQAAVDRALIEALHAEIVAAADESAVLALVKKPAARAALTAAQAQLVCDGFLSPSKATGILSQSAQIGLDAFRRRNMIVSSGGLDADSAAALALSGEELDFRAVLRVLRERVADAAGLVEDGSASGKAALVADRAIDLRSAGASDASGALADGAPDLVGAATDAAARALGWTSAAGLRAFVGAGGRSKLRDLRVAVKLPAAPAYHGPAMELRAEIDRGDVFYDTPIQAALARKRLGTVRRPTFVLYAKVGDAERPLVRWSTTIGGWKKERIEEGEVVLRYKESDVGERLWRHLVAAPAWLPPDSTPEADLLSESDDGSLTLKRDLIEPGYRNAYGLVMLVHDEQVYNDTEVAFEDHGIRTHGSVDYRSIVRGQSHGCHRLYNHLALRLGGYLLAHRHHIRRGKLYSTFHRTLESKGQKIELEVPIRGYLYELDPPVPVRVLEGRIAGEMQTPITSQIRLKRDPTSG